MCKYVQAVRQTLPCPASVCTTSEWGHLGRSSWSWNLPQNVMSFLSGVALCEDLEVLIIFCASEQEGGAGGDVLFPVGTVGSDKQLELEWRKESLEGAGCLTRGTDCRFLHRKPCKSQQ